jgi:hypothetical protein
VTHDQNQNTADGVFNGGASRHQHCLTTRRGAKQLLGNGLLYDQFMASRGDNANKIKLAGDGYSDPKTSS